MSETLRVLQVEDSESDAALIIRLVQKAGYNVYSRRVEEAELMRQALAQQDWDIVLADHQLPQFDAGAALRIMHESGQDLPFIVVSGMIDADRAAELMRAGAHDYVLKDRLARLVPAIQREIRDALLRCERRRAEELLKDRDEWLALVVNVTHLAMFDFYPQTGKLIWTGDVRRHFGLPPDAEVTDETFLRGLHPDDRERVVDLIRRASNPESGGEYAADYRIIGYTDQVERSLAAHGRVFFDSEGKATRFVGVTIDITERKQLEEQFRQAQKLEGVGRLAGGVAHDFNNLLTVITGFSQMTLDELPMLHPLRSGVEEVLKAASTATGITRQLLAFSRRQPSHAEALVLNEIVKNARKMLGRLVGADVDLALRLSPSAGVICADAGHIEQVIMNLVVNAKDAMPLGGNLVIETARRVITQYREVSHPELVPGEYAALIVSDTGTGMSSEVRAHIFDPFFTTKQVGKGTGLGLSTVYGIVKQYGGSISVESELGSGTQFTALFPAVETQIGKPVAPSVLPLPTGTETILLAEDEAAVRLLVRLTLERQGYRVLECSNGLEAMRQVRQNAEAIHLLVTDAVMPEMGGAELAGLFAACCPGVPVLCMCGYSGLTWPGSAIEANYLQKPFTPAVLLARVRALLDRTEEPRESSASVVSL